MSPRSSVLVVALAFALAQYAPRVAAQATTDAVCTNSTYDWTFNSKHQTPCLIAAYAQAPCHNGDWNVPKLDEGQYYVGPRSEAQATPCTCSSPVWSLLMACSYCQNATYFIDWPAWSTNCTTVYPNYPSSISPSTSIPAWAYLRVPADGQWNPDLARADLDAPESTATNLQSTATNLPSSSTTSSATLTPTSRTSTVGLSTTTASSVPTSGSSSGGGGGGSNAGAIAGGVVGGVVALAAIGLIIFFLRKRRRQRSELAHAGPPSATPYDPPSMAQAHSSPPTSGYAPSATAYAPSTAPMHEPKPYNPNDPSTFPHAMAGGAPPHGSYPSPGPSDQLYGSHYQQGANPFHTPTATPSVPTGQQPVHPNRGGYSGVPEV